ncbi:hypothetical protein Pla175_31640 [Pirellulimonas nuda]|uniref:Uncharacterized protein n=1 Tax=Pirellulimonas nuda TaxID=2528009 RepID=A0A518DE71_9BACT|nr:hypothetical protein [Pirellulimonas nuda]QDU89769.1 hypothetical protein Pla175_31640 [Pirellulimonas nuda]
MTPRPRSLAAFAACALGVLLLWCVALPWLSARPAVRDRLRFLERRGVDASAMYYTELDAMDAILDRYEGREVRRRGGPPRR